MWGMWRVDRGGGGALMWRFWGKEWETCGYRTRKHAPDAILTGRVQRDRVSALSRERVTPCPPRFWDVTLNGSAWERVTKLGPMRSRCSLNPPAIKQRAAQLWLMRISHPSTHQQSHTRHQTNSTLTTPKTGSLDDIVFLWKQNTGHQLILLEPAVALYL